MTAIDRRTDELLRNQRTFLSSVILLPRSEKSRTSTLVDASIYGPPEALQDSTSLIHCARQRDEPVVLRAQLLVALSPPHKLLTREHTQRTNWV